MWKITTKYFWVNSRQRAIFIATSLTILAIISAATASFISKNSVSAAEGEGERVLTIYDDGQKQAFRTDAVTIRQALKEKNIELSQNDSVEPSLDDKLSGTDYNVNIYRARPILVQDGIIREKVMSSGQTAKAIAKEAKLNLYDEDRVELENSNNPAEDGVATQITITRAKIVNVDLYGKVSAMRTQANTINDFLIEKKIKLGPNDELSLPADTKVINGGSFSIWRNGVHTTTTEEEIGFEIEKIEDADKDEGFKEVKEAGEKGKKQVVYEVEMKSGQEISRKIISEVEVKKAKKQIEIVGIKKKGPSAYTGGGNKDEWLRAAGIPSQYWAYVDSIVSRESGWNPNAMNSSSGACGLAQALPCSKVPGNGLNPVDSLRWMNGYVSGRYGGWEGAYNFWQSHHWY